MSDLVLILAEAIAVLGFAQMVIWFNNARWGPQRRLEMLSQSPLIELVNYGFTSSSALCAGYIKHDQKRCEVGYKGQVGGHAVEIYFDPKTGWLTHPNFRVRVYFSPNGVEKALPQNFLRNISDRDNTFRSEYISLTANYVEDKVSIGKFGWPKTERLIVAASLLARELSRVGV